MYVCVCVHEKVACLVDILSNETRHQQPVVQMYTINRTLGIMHYTYLSVYMYIYINDKQLIFVSDYIFERESKNNI